MLLQQQAKHDAPDVRISLCATACLQIHSAIDHLVHFTHPTLRALTVRGLSWHHFSFTLLYSMIDMCLRA